MRGFVVHCTLGRSLKQSTAIGELTLMVRGPSRKRAVLFSMGIDTSILHSESTCIVVLGGADDIDRGVVQGRY